ncbi:AAA family ATPase [Aquimarina sp. TRL1]|uniref:ATP-dependent DNA helicase n=1 Tax=Aquimarina sp. (strain TRL1) TaxID=2736252 RepID=UPI00158B2B1B|nr:DEAD/DEAH box helicase [Aquimarina sp. TRL1]QKX05407.1 AAA family ATPase [Aquimarina sp. TRL1]
MQDKLEFSKEAINIIECVNNTNENLFITGKAGTGKSTLLKYIQKNDSSIIVLAPTGIAAINVNGETIHSFFKLKPGYEFDEAMHVRINNNMISQYAAIHTIIIDEISMVRADILDAVDIFLQRIRNTSEPFGGIRMIFFGDLFQLPPVILNNEREKFLQKYKTPYFFSAHSFIQKDLFTSPFIQKTLELKTIYRQKDLLFIDILNAVRENKTNDSHLSLLNQQVKTSIEDENSNFQISLVPTNAIANSINFQKLQTLNTSEISFFAHHTGNIENLKPNDFEVKLKIGAQVMFLNNDPKKRWMNGTIGNVTNIASTIDEETNENYQFVEVELENGNITEVLPFTWEISKYRFKRGRFVREEIGTFTQIPIKLAWAITIHKSQGKTFNKVKIDLGTGSFAHGQTYVALSRCKTLSNITLTRPILKSDIIIDEPVIEFIKN